MTTQSKCMFGSALVHALLLVCLIVGSAFVSPKKTVESLQIHHVFKVTDDESHGNGVAGTPMTSDPTPAPAPAPATALAPTPAPAPAPKPVEQTQPKEVKQTPKSIQKPKKTEKKVTPLPETKVTDKPKVTEKPKVVTKPPETHQIEPSFTTVKPDPKVAEEKAARRREQQEKDRQRQAEAKRKYDEAMAAYQRSLSDANAKAQRDASERLQALSKVTDVLGSSLSGTSSLVTMPEPGGEAFVNYSQLIWSQYYNAWRPPTERSQDATVRVRIVISKEGRVISAQVVGRSGDAGLDKSVREALDRVRSFPPFPEGARDNERTFNIEFNLKAKRLIG